MVAAKAARFLKLAIVAKTLLAESFRGKRRSEWLGVL
jgi:hypothetical protein